MTELIRGGVEDHWSSAKVSQLHLHPSSGHRFLLSSSPEQRSAASRCPHDRLRRQGVDMESFESATSASSSFRSEWSSDGEHPPPACECEEIPSPRWLPYSLRSTPSRSARIPAERPRYEAAAVGSSSALHRGEYSPPGHFGREILADDGKEQKMVIRVTMSDAKKRSKAMKLAAGLTTSTFAFFSGLFLQQKVVIKVQMADAKKRSQAMKLAVGLTGVLSAAIEGADRNQIVAVGEGVNSIALTTLLRKQMGGAELVSVSTIEEKKKEAGREQAGEAGGHVETLL